MIGTEIQFWDGNKRRNWFVVRAITRKILARPEILAEMREWVELHWKSDMSKGRPYRLWSTALRLSPKDFAGTILADTPEAQETRESLPPCIALTGREMADAIAAARVELAVA